MRIHIHNTYTYTYIQFSRVVTRPSFSASPSAPAKGELSPTGT